MATKRRYDVVVMGGSGFTGVRVAKELAIISASRGRGEGDKPFTWAAAGRSVERMKAAWAGMRIPPEFHVQEPQYVVADAADEASLRAMAESAVVVINCAGPFRFLGMPVVTACIEAGTHYVDVTGEPEFMESVEASLHDRAAEKGVLVVSACGFDSIPADLGALHTVESFPPGARATSCESFLRVSGGPAGVRVNFATWESAVWGIANAGNLRRLRKNAPARLQARPPLYAAPIKRMPSTYWWEKRMQRYAMPFPGSDASVVKRTQRLLHEARTAGPGSAGAAVPPTPVQYTASFVLPSRWALFLTLVFGQLLMMLSNSRLGRWLLLKFPEAFSWGTFSRQGPTVEQMEGTHFEMTHFGKGFRNAADAPEGGKGTPDYEVVTRVRGPEPGYIATPIFVTQCALTILAACKWGNDTLPSAGGVLTPGAAFRGTHLIQRLKERGIEFSVVREGAI